MIVSACKCESNNKTNVREKHESQSDTVFRALHTYFVQLTFERGTDCKNLTIVVDNAHIPLSEEHMCADQGTRKEALSQSLSAINTLSFPPPFLVETEDGASRWNSIEIRGASRRLRTESDFAVPKPSRTRDDYESESQSMDKTMHHRFPRGIRSPVPTKRTMRRLAIIPGSAEYKKYRPPRPSPSLDSTERLLRELPRVRNNHMTPTLGQMKMIVPSLERNVPKTGHTSISAMKDEDLKLPAFSEKVKEVPCDDDSITLLAKGKEAFKPFGNHHDANPAQDEEASYTRKKVVAGGSGHTCYWGESDLTQAPCGVARWDQMIGLRSSLRAHGIIPPSLTKEYPFTISPFHSLQRSEDFPSQSSADPSSSKPYPVENLSVVMEHDAVDRIIETTVG